MSIARIFVFVVQCFPRVGFVEKKIEEVQILRLSFIAGEFSFSLLSTARRLRRASLPASRASPRHAQGGRAEVVQPRQGLSSPQGSERRPGSLL
jgi:hypothetical protein